MLGQGYSATARSPTVLDEATNLLLTYLLAFLFTCLLTLTLLCSYLFTSLSKEVEENERWVTHPGQQCWWVLAGCTCAVSWYDAKEKMPEADHIVMTERFGVQGCVIIWEWSDIHIKTWLVKEQNRWQSGSGYNIQQFFDDTFKMAKAWRGHCHLKGYGDGWLGTGATSHDQMCWAYLCEKYKQDIRHQDVTEFLRTKTLLQQLESLVCVQPDGQELSAFKDLLLLLKRRCDHHNVQWSFHVFCRMAYHIESGMRGLLGKTCALSRRCIMVTTLMEFCLPLCGKVTSRFDLFKNTDNPRITKLLSM